MSAKTLAVATCALTAAAAGVVGCNQNHAAAGPTINLSSSSSKFCTPFRAAQPGAPNGAATDLAGNFEECVHRWGYTLAPARDSADVVAQAVIDACDADLSRWDDQAAAQVQQGSPNNGPQTIPEQMNGSAPGQPTEAASDHARYAQERALFYVVQARAGNCAPPPQTQVTQSGAGVG